MVFLARVIGILFAALGMVFIVRADWGKKIFAFWKEENNLYIMGVARLAFGIIFLLAAIWSHHPLPTLILGFLFLLKGVVIFAIPLEDLKKIVDFWENLSPFVLRLVGFLVVAFGALIVTVV